MPLFNRASNFTINGGTFNDFSREVVIHHHWHYDSHRTVQQAPIPVERHASAPITTPALTHDQLVKKAKRASSPYGAPITTPALINGQCAKKIKRASAPYGALIATRARTNDPVVKTAERASAPDGPTQRIPWASPSAFSVLNYALDRLNAVVEPHSSGIFKKLHADLQGLALVATILRRAYQACRKTDLGRLVREDIHHHLSQCILTLTQVHDDVVQLPYRWVPPWRRFGSVLYVWHWWTAVEEPEEVSSIRKLVNSQVKTLGSCLVSLKSFVWAEELFDCTTQDSQFRAQELTEFLCGAPPSLRHISVEEIIVIEPLGKPLAIPIRFTNTLDDVHFFVQQGCRGTKGSFYIDQKRYQLDDPCTNQALDDTLFHQNLRPGKTFEVSVLVQATSMSSNKCPRCGHENRSDLARRENGWVNCEACRMMVKVTEVTSPERPAEPKEEDTSCDESSPTEERRRYSMPSNPRRRSRPVSPSASNGAIQEQPLEEVAMEVTPEETQSTLMTEGDVLEARYLFRRMLIQLVVDNQTQASVVQEDGAVVESPTDPWFVGEYMERFQQSPWYLRPNLNPSEIIMDHDGSIRAATLEVLVERLTAHEETLDHAFKEAFLLTFKTFTTLNELVDHLIARFLIQPPKGLTSEEHEHWVHQKQRVVQTRVLGMLKSLLQPGVLDDDDLLVLGKIERFLQSRHLIGFTMASKVLLNLIARATIRRGARERISSTSMPSPPAPIISKFSKTSGLLLDIHPLELARQLTLMESEFYQRISSGELLRRAWKQGRRDNIFGLIEFSNKIVNWVVNIILSKEDPRKRVALIKYFITVAERCRSLNNFASMVSIISALNLPPVKRLKRTWGRIPPKETQLFSSCEKIIDSANNFTTYRQLMTSVRPPCVPFIGAYTSMLDFLRNVNHDNLIQSGGLINFRKRQKVWEVIMEATRFSNEPYNLQSVPFIQNYIRNSVDIRTRGDDYYWERSLMLEPRE
ncbi:TKL/TKL-ccin protein kinase [Coprinopsis cinerea AmutBmut pab1-1]|nr:TKL/TKL-ccin protein kinase [Coprinopsis cinerea AmutBmut pab1-1]